MHSLLVIDDDAGLHDLVDYHLEGVVDKILHAMTPAQGIKMALGTPPSVILLDIEMPRMDGFAVCRCLREHHATCDVPIIFLTCDKSKAHVRKALESGGQDYVTKPFEPIELQARVRTAARLHHLIGLLKKDTQVDALTGLPNRESLERAIGVVASRHARQAEPHGVLMLRVEGMNQINNAYGYGIGDEVLRRTATVLSGTCRPHDHVARWGGNEFVVVIANVNPVNAELVSRRFLKRIGEIGGCIGKPEIAGCCSGVLTVVCAGVSVQPGFLLEEAQAALDAARSQEHSRLAVNVRQPDKSIGSS